MGNVLPPLLQDIFYRDAHSKVTAHHQTTCKDLI